MRQQESLLQVNISSMTFSLTMKYFNKEKKESFQ